MERHAVLLVAPDVAVYGLVTDGEEFCPAQVARDLFGAPLLAQQLFDEREVASGEALVAARARAAAVGALLGGEGAVAAVGPGAVAPDFAADRGAVAAERERAI